MALCATRTQSAQHLPRLLVAGGPALSAPALFAGVHVADIVPERVSRTAGLCWTYSKPI
jgi:hypothetical protein